MAVNFPCGTKRLIPELGRSADMRNRDPGRFNYQKPLQGPWPAPPMVPLEAEASEAR